MGAGERNDDLTPAILDLIAEARAKEHVGAHDRRERITERAVAAAFLVAAIAVLVIGDGLAAVPIGMSAWLVALCFVLLQIEFEVGEGRTRPVQLVLMPMFFLLPPALVPLLVVVAQLLAHLPADVARRKPLTGLSSTVADSWFALGPALVLVWLEPSGVTATAAVVVLAVLAQIAIDFAVAVVRLRVGAGIDVRPQLASFAWVYGVDVLLTPVGLLAAAVGRVEPWAVAAVLPLAALLAVFARERHGRIENALELRRMAEQNEARLESIVQNSSDLIAILAPDGAIRILTGATDGVFGEDRHEAIGTLIRDWAHPDDVPLVDALLATVSLGDSQASHAAEWRIRRADDRYGYVETLATNLLGDERIGGIVLTARDIDERRAFEEQLRHRAFHDPLTGLANRALFYDRIEHALSRGTGDEQHVAVLFIDLDDFKVVNDSMGHAVGDELLIAVAARLRGCIRSADTAARFGGDEFGLLLEHVAGPNEVVNIAERVMTAFESPVVVHGEAIVLSVSIGMVLSAPEDRSADELLRRADLAMYAAKSHGKRRWDFYDGDLERLAGTTDRGTEPERGTWFQRGLEQREEIAGLVRRDDAIRMVFQPILDLRTGRVAGYEALARINSAESRPPNAWFAQAHRCGLGYELEAKAIAAALAAPGRPPGTYLTVNASPSALTSAPVQAVLPESLKDIVVELTENELAADVAGLDEALADVRRRGGRIAIDDAGAGYAGLKHVMRIGPDLIKLDRSLVAGVEADDGRAALISSFVQYGRDSGAAVCAEGIETIGDLVRLADLDVTFGQGYAIARPGEDWPDAASEPARACATSFTATLADPHASAPGVEGVAALLSAARDLDGLAGVSRAIARQLRADDAAIYRLDPTGPRLDPVGTAPELDLGAVPAHVRQVLATDAHADPGDRARLQALNRASLLRVPVTCEGALVGALELHRVHDEPWSRFEISHARTLAHHLGACLERIQRRASLTNAR